MEDTKITTFNYNDDKYFIAKNYTPHDDCERMYFSNKNAVRIDFIRNTIEAWKKANLLTELEYYYLLAALIEGVPSVSNTTGTYGAYLKQWDNRSHKELELLRLNVLDNGRNNKCYNKDALKLITEIEGNIIYIDPPYNERQYAPNYHLLETISKYDYPEIKGVTGMRPYAEQKSPFCIKSQVHDAFEELISKAKFDNVVLSYSTDGIMSYEEIEDILKKYGLPDTYKKYTIPYRKYKSKKDNSEHTLCEYLFYIKMKINHKSFEKYASSMIFPIGEPNDSFAQYFSGKSFLAPVSKDQVGIFNVTFEPKCRNNWHIHKAKNGGGQILICVAGRGYYQEWGKKAIEMLPGDVVNIPANVKHWHGASADSYFSHLAIEVPGENTSNEWLEAVSDEEYFNAINS